MARIAVSLTLACTAIACSFETSPIASGTVGARSDDTVSDSDGTVLDASAGDSVGSATRAGAGGPGPVDASVAQNACDGLCPGDRPVCLSTRRLCVQCASDANCTSPDAPAYDLATNVCVACNQDVHCSGHAPRCDRAATACVQCIDDADCMDPTAPRCDPDSRECAGCLAHADCAGGTPVCDPQAQQCVECLSHADCGDLAHPQCQDRQCVPCTSEHACAGRSGTSVCDSDGSPRAGACVQCTIVDETSCDGTACDPESRTCTDRPLASKEACQPCIADSECVADHHCIAMRYAGEPLVGGACLRRAAAGCERPYAAAPINRASLSGAAPEDYCGIDEQETTCAAVVALIAGAECSEGEDGECVAQGGLCDTVNGAQGRCSYPCTAPQQCPPGFLCNDYCGGSNSGGGPNDGGNGRE